jgi:hypothetical protein
MKTNEILEDIYRIREEHARACSYDVTASFARMRDHFKELEAQGWWVVSPEPLEIAAAGFFVRNRRNQFRHRILKRYSRKEAAGESSNSKIQHSEKVHASNFNSRRTASARGLRLI